MGKIRQYSGSFAALCAVVAIFVPRIAAADSSSSSSFGPLSAYSGPSGIQPIPGVTAACPGMQASGLDQGIDAIGKVLHPTKGSSSSASGSNSCSAQPPSDSNFKDCSAFPQLSSSSSSSKKGLADDPVIGQLISIQNGYKSCEASIEAVKGEMSTCLAQTEQMLEQATNLFENGDPLTHQPGFMDAYNFAKQVMVNQHAKEDDVQSQVKQMNEALNGGDNNSGGLRNMQTNLVKMTSDSYDGIQQLTTTGAAIQRGSADVAARTVRVMFEKMQSCLNNPSTQPSLRCPGDPTTPQSVINWLKCHVQNSNSKVGGQMDPSFFAKQNGTSAANTSSASLNNLFVMPAGLDFSSLPNYGQTGQLSLADTANMANSISGTAYAAWVSQNLSGLQGSANGYSVQSLLQPYATYCYSKSIPNVVAPDSNNPDEQQLAGAVAQLTDAMNANQTAFNKLTDTFSTEYTNDLSQLCKYMPQYSTCSVTPQALMSSTGCNPSGQAGTIQSTLSQRNACATNLQANLKSMLTSMPLQLQFPSKFNSGSNPASDPSHPLNWGTGFNMPACHGVNDCIAKLESSVNERKHYGETLATARKQFGAAQTQFLNNQLLQPSIKNANATIQYMNTVLQDIANKIGSLGGHASIGLNLNVKRGGAMKSDDDGLPVLPDDGVRSLIPSVDLSSTKQDINSALNDAKTQLGDRESKLNDLIAQANRQEQSCQQQAQLNRLDRAAQNFVGACSSNGKNIYVCGNNSSGDDKSSYTDIVSSTISDITQIAGKIDAGTASSLASNDASSLNGYVSGCTGVTSLGSAAKVVANRCGGCSPDVTDNTDDGSNCVTQFTANLDASKNNQVSQCNLAQQTYAKALAAVPTAQMVSACDSAYNMLRSAKENFETGADKENSKAGSGS